MGGGAPGPSQAQTDAQNASAALARQQLQNQQDALAENEHERQAGYLGYQSLFGSAGYNTPLGTKSLLGDPGGAQA